MRLFSFASRLFVLLCIFACDRGVELKANDGLTMDSVSLQVRKSVRPPLPPLVPSAEVLAPDTAAMSRPAPDSFDIVFETSQGDIEVAVVRAWAPLGVDRLYYLTTHGFFDAMRFYKVQRDFIAQFGFSGDIRVTAAWERLPLRDDPIGQPHVAGTLAFAANGPNSRTTQLFFNLRDNSGLEQSGLTVVGRIVRGMEILPRLYDVHGQGLGVDRIRQEGNGYLDGFPNLDYILRARVTR
jgi:peptidyl-prolyl cis-trans isomerase A (cyclophilin A)